MRGYFRVGGALALSLCLCSSSLFSCRPSPAVAMREIVLSQTRWCGNQIHTKVGGRGSEGPAQACRVAREDVGSGRSCIEAPGLPTWVAVDLGGWLGSQGGPPGIQRPGVGVGEGLGIEEGLGSLGLLGLRDSALACLAPRVSRSSGR